MQGVERDFAEDLDSNRYTIRRLEESEERKWIEMVASCFAAKGTPRDVFSSHLERTPSNERIILAAIDKGAFYNYPES